MLLSITQLEQSANRYLPVEDLKSKGLIEDSTAEITKDNILDPAENLAKRKAMLESSSPEPPSFAFERVIGKNDSVYSNFIELILAAKRKVGRIAIKNGARNLGFATGFMVSENLLLTNWHVFRSADEVADSEIQFFYEYNTLGNPQSPVSFKLQPALFFHANKELDYCFVGVSPTDLSGKVTLHEIGYIFLDPTLGKLGHEGQEALNIIHHPNGDYMQLSIRENLFKKITPTSIWYTTDTAPGSSGGPVFNDQWQVVALHHMGVAKKREGQYIDKKGAIIPIIDGKIDETRIVWEANEGIRISVILKDLLLSYTDHPLVNALKQRPMGQNHRVSPPEEQLPLPSLPSVPSKDLVNISFPASLITQNGVLNISINQGSAPSMLNPAAPPAPLSEEDLLFQEIKRLEQNADFQACKGYQARFLGAGHRVPFPRPQAAIRKFIAKVANTDEILLNYHHYSVIQHALRKMPLISGINIDGDPLKRQDDSPRRDTWLRDTRLSFDLQLDDNFYRNSGFNRGHMSRREDANWGNTPEEAKRNADMTCFFTNACPQVAKINQSSRKGLWGILEKVVLENGASQEQGHTGKITVFNGPIFKDNDPVFRGVQIPLDFFKIVLWLTDSNQLKATAFKLSQQELLDEVDFEQLDLDQNTTFKAFQCSIKSLQKATKIDFSTLFKFDTFEAPTEQEIALDSAQEVLTHLQRHQNGI